MARDNPWASPWLRALIVLLVAIAAYWLISQVWSVTLLFSDIILLFFLAWLLAFLLGPPARQLQRWGTPRILAVLAVYLGLGILATVAGLLVIPTIVQQLSNMADNLRFYTQRLDILFTDLQSLLVRLGFRQIDLTAVSTNLLGQLQTITGVVLQNSITIATSVATLVLNSIIVLILSFYIMLDGERLGKTFVGGLPPRYRGQAKLFTDSMEKKFGGFVWGQLFVGTFYGLVTGLAMWPAGLDFKLIVGIVAGVAMMIPFIGGFLAIIPPIAIALVQNPGSAWWLLIVLLVLQQVTLQVISPRLMSETVGIHPLLVFLALLVGAKVYGVWGALFGIPLAGVLDVMVRYVYHAFIRPSRFYQETENHSPPGDGKTASGEEATPTPASHP
jgi:predicted PurR-regulated permease PerM